MHQRFSWNPCQNTSSIDVNTLGTSEVFLLIPEENNGFS